VTKVEENLIWDLAEELEAVLMLEYHNKNQLVFGTNPKRLNEEQRYIVRRIKSLVRPYATQ
jgi:hypothetical protein